MGAVQALRAAARRRQRLGPAGLRAFWGGRRGNLCGEHHLGKACALLDNRPDESMDVKDEREMEADGAVPVKEKRSKPSLICPLPCSRSYLPPKGLQSCLESQVREVFGPSLPEDWQQTPLQENRLKHHLLARLAAELGHAVPNSQLHQMRRAGDVLGFYHTPMKDGSKIDELVATELPLNLQIIWQH
ncbi:39S ribosomal protein L50, mitochondrial-like isoform X2 [Oenanthe melanoleuca]|uniref:39S ribosomal protein L50, mitochondrial-like isoform X2 n=2 Tax=Oenanthe melanoleuca TaxID=2939378 RepID=UPI0024C1C674|nr:39S ribosomal protein L50, mitochondrial-like isoform X2 [Oenanthe melanoleuca]